MNVAIPVLIELHVDYCDILKRLRNKESDDNEKKFKKSAECKVLFLFSV